MNRFSKILIVALLLFAAIPSMGAQFAGGFGYLHTNCALVLPRGSSEFGLYARSYVGGVKHITSGNLYDGTSAISGAYGYTNNAEIGFSQILYQDINHTLDDNGQPPDEPDKYMIPGDIYLRLKYGNIRIIDNTFMAIMPVLRYQTSKYHDVQFEPYSSGSLEYEIMMLFSYYDEPLFPDEGLALHANAGFTFYNDDTRGDGTSANSASWLFSVMYPVNRALFDIGLEIYGLKFINSPGWRVLGREDWIYLTPMVRSKIYHQFRLTLGVDVLLYGLDDSTILDRGLSYSQYYNYSTWRITSRVNYTPSMQPLTGLGLPSQYYRSTHKEYQNLIADRREMFRWAMDNEGRQLNLVDIDLEKIRQERKKAEAELEQLKVQLQEKELK